MDRVRSVALQVRNRLQVYGVQADADTLFDLIYDEMQDLAEDTTLRDQLAMAALQGFMSQPDERTWRESLGVPLKEWQNSIIDSDARYCYQVADAMLKARRERSE